jgi:hypothetical protein
MEAAVLIMKRLIDHQVLEIISSNLQHTCSELSGICSVPACSSQAHAGKACSGLTDSCQNGAAPQKVSSSQDVTDTTLSTSQFCDMSLHKELDQGMQVQHWLHRLARWSSVNDEGICTIPQDRLADWAWKVLTHGLAEGRATLDQLLELHAKDRKQTVVLWESLLERVRHVQRVSDAAKRGNQIKVDTEVQSLVLGEA